MSDLQWSRKDIVDIMDFDVMRYRAEVMRGRKKARDDEEWILTVSIPKKLMAKLYEGRVCTGKTIDCIVQEALSLYYFGDFRGWKE